MLQNYYRMRRRNSARGDRQVNRVYARSGGSDSIFRGHYPKNGQLPFLGLPEVPGRGFEPTNEPAVVLQSPRYQMHHRILPLDDTDHAE